MALNLYNIKKWLRMFTGRSVMHVNQDLGKVFEKNSIAGYYNNLTEKVTMLPDLLETTDLPLYTTPSGDKVTFPVDIFQYGLGAYDLYLINNNKVYLDKFYQCCEWAIENQEDNGAWNTFFFKYKNDPYGAMSQGEATSLLLRGYKQFSDTKYLVAAQKAIEFMLKPISEGGTTDYRENGDVLLCEYTHLPVVMNGWIFAWWGLQDYVITTGKYEDICKKTEESLRKYLPSFTNTYWSQYDTEGKMASPFYHRLHIAQMQAMYILTGNTIYDNYSKRWTKNLNNPLFKLWALVRKAIQKINEKEAWT